MKHIFYTLFLMLLVGCSNPSANKKINHFDYSSTEVQLDSKKTEDLAELKSFSSLEKINKNVLKMELQNGVRYIWVEINGISLKFIFDTGASSISISSAEATVLFRQGTLKEEDIIGIEYFQDATGRISEGAKINLRTVKLGNVVLENVEATVIENIDAPLLLGQSVLERFGKIEIDNKNNVIIFD